MKLKYILAAGIISAASVAQAQEWTADTANMTAGYANNVYYSLADGSVKSEAANNWDIAFRTGIYSGYVFANHAGSTTMVYPMPGISAEEKFGTDLTSDTVGVATPANALYNSTQTWSSGAFNADGGSSLMDYGWGTYDGASHWLSGDKIYMVVTASGVYQVWIEQVKTFNSASFPVENPPVWTFHIADINGANVKDKELNINPTYSDRLFAYYSITNDEFVNRDPENEGWDFVFTQYNEEVAPGMMYKVTGILSNEGRDAARISGEGASETAWGTAVESQMSDTINKIGRDWKGSLASFTDPTYPIVEDRSYFMKVANGDVWQFEFTHASVGSTTSSSDPSVLPGRVGLRKRKVFTAPLSAGDVKSQLSAVVLAPNPAVSGVTNLVIDAKENVSAAVITIADISGRVVFESNTNIKAGLQQLRLDVSQFTPGMYFVNVGAQGWSNTQKLIVN